MLVEINNLYNTNPFINLALEEYCVRNLPTDDQHYLIFYTNTPTIVVGKNQQIFEEANSPYCLEHNISLARRISGGGAVYHDAGNLNIALISSFQEKRINNYVPLLQPIVQALKSLGINAEINKRNDITVDGYKISGSAQFTDRKNVLSHCTLLVNAQTKLISKALRPEAYTIESKSMKSVRSAVQNINDFSGISLDLELIKGLIRERMISENDFIGLRHLAQTEWHSILDLAERQYQADAWIYGRSPKAVIKTSKFNITIENGIAVNIEDRYKPNATSKSDYLQKMLTPQILNNLI